MDKRIKDFDYFDLKIVGIKQLKTYNKEGTLILSLKAPFSFSSTISKDKEILNYLFSNWNWNKEVEKWN